MFIVDDREKMVSENRALCSLAQLVLCCATEEQKKKEEVKEALVDLSKSRDEVSLLFLEVALSSKASDGLQRLLDNYQQELVQLRAENLELCK